MQTTMIPGCLGSCALRLMHRRHAVQPGTADTKHRNSLYRNGSLQTTGSWRGDVGVSIDTSPHNIITLPLIPLIDPPWVTSEDGKQISN